MIKYDKRKFRIFQTPGVDEANYKNPPPYEPHSSPLSPREPPTPTNLELEKSKPRTPSKPTIPWKMENVCCLCPPSNLPYYDSLRIKECKKCHKKFCPEHIKPKKHYCEYYKDKHEKWKNKEFKKSRKKEIV